MATASWIATLSIGGLVGMTELVNRYRDDPWDAIKTPPGILYLLVNAAASALALVLVGGLQIDFGMEPGPSLTWARVLAAGFGAMALFRSSVFNVRVGDQDVAIGPAGLLQVLLGAIDRSVDRVRARIRAEKVPTVMAGISFARAREALPAYCLALMQNLSPEDQKVLGTDLKALIESDMSDEVKTLILGLALTNAIGLDALEAATESLGENIRQP